MDFENEFISLTDIAKYKSNAPNDVIKHWMRSRETLEFLGLWETLHNPDFKPVEFDGFRKEAGLHAFTMSPSKWIESVNAIGITTKAGRYGGTYAHSDIAQVFSTLLDILVHEADFVHCYWTILLNAEKLSSRICCHGFYDSIIRIYLSHNPVSIAFLQLSPSLPPPNPETALFLSSPAFSPYKKPG